MAFFQNQLATLKIIPCVGTSSRKISNFQWLPPERNLFYHFLRDFRKFAGLLEVPVFPRQLKYLVQLEVLKKD